MDCEVWMYYVVGYLVGKKFWVGLGGIGEFVDVVVEIYQFRYVYFYIYLGVVFQGVLRGGIVIILGLDVVLQIQWFRLRNKEGVFDRGSFVLGFKGGIVYEKGLYWVNVVQFDRLIKIVINGVF